VVGSGVLWQAGSSRDAAIAKGREHKRPPPCAADLALLHVHRNFSLRQGKLHTATLPRAPDTENLGIKVFVSHGKSA